MTQRGSGLTALVCFGAAATACGGWVELQSAETGAGGATAGTVGATTGAPASTGGTVGSSAAGQGQGQGQAGKSQGMPEAGGVGGELLGEAGSGPESPILSVLAPPAPQLIPDGADGPGITFSASAVIDVGSLERGALAGATEYCFKKPQSQYTCDWQSREPFVWTEATGMRPLDRLNPGGLSFFPTHVSGDGDTVVGVHNTASGSGFFRWTKAAGATSLGEPAGTVSGQPFGMSSDGKTVVGLAKVDGKSGVGHEQFVWSEQGGYSVLGQSAGWPAEGEVVGVTADGATVFGQTTFASETHSAFRWTPQGGAELLPGLPGLSYCWIERSTPDGAALFGTCSDAQRIGHAFRWTEAGGTQSLSNPSDACALRGIFSVSADGNTAFGTVECGDNVYAPGRWSAVAGVSKLPSAPTGFRADLGLTGSSNGDVAFGSLLPVGGPQQPGGAGSAAFRWTAATGLVPLPPPSGQNFTAASAIDAQGLVLVGHSGVANTTNRAVMWDASGLLDITSYVTGHGVDLRGLELTHSERVAVTGDTILIQGFANANNRGGTWFARIPLKR
ncbi:MAG TPA: hypothetical protein VIW29_15680 [Polyangiaceae bacterium]